MEAESGSAMDVNADYSYTKEHEWIHIDGNSATIGITDYAQGALGDITYVELPTIGAEVEQFEQYALIESVKAASDIFSPMSGKISEVNSELQSTPELINKSCYEKGWMAKIELSHIDEKANLMKANEYQKFLESLQESESAEDDETPSP